MVADSNEMRIPDRVLRREAASLDEIGAGLRASLDPATMTGPAAERLRERLFQRAASLNSATDQVLDMANTLERSATVVDQQGALGGWVTPTGWVTGATQPGWFATSLAGDRIPRRSAPDGRLVRSGR